LSRPVLTGPHNGNAREVLQALQAADAVRIVADGEQLGRTVAALLADTGARQQLGAHAQQVVAESRGACARVMDLLMPLLDGTSRGNGAA
jgi:3-deoxy-D-manno-octulosonic-acid transferase